MARLLSIYITLDSIDICEVSKTAKGINVHQTYRTNIPKGCIDDGVIIDVPKVAEVIKSVLTDKRTRKAKLVFVVSSRRIANKEVVIPFIKDKKKIEEIITANAQDYFPMSNINDYIYRYTILEIFEEEGRKQYRLSAVAVQKDLIASYYELAAELPMPIETIDYYGNSVFQILKQQMEEKSTLVLQIEKDMTNISIMSGKSQVFRRMVPFGKDTIVQAIAEIKDIPREEAEELLYNRADSDRRGEGLTNEEYSEAIREMIASIVRIVDFHTSRNPGTIIEEVKIFGECGNTTDLPDIMTRELGIPVTAPKYLTNINVKMKDGLGEEKMIEYLPNLGAVLNSLNLKIVSEKEQGADSYRIYAITLGGAVLISVVLVGITLFGYFDLKEQEQQLETQIASIQSIEELYSGYGLVMADLEALKNYYNGTQSPSENLYQFILDMEQVMPESVGITQLSAAEGDLTITGVAAGKEAVAKMVMELKELDYISEVRVQNIVDTYDELNNPNSIFNMTLRFRNMQITGDTQSADNEQGGITDEVE